MTERSGFHRWTAEQVIELRAALRASQAGLAQLLGVRQQTISDWETGTHVPQGASKRLLSMVAEQAAEYRALPEPPPPSGAAE